MGISNEELTSNIVMAPPDEQLVSYTDQFITAVNTQIVNWSSDRFGTCDSDIDLFNEFLKLKYNISVDDLHDFESHMNTDEDSDDYDNLTNRFTMILESKLGIYLDTDITGIYLIDLYYIYLIFILDIKNTIKHAVSYTDNMGVKDIKDKLFDDDYSPNEDFLQSASDNDLGNSALERLVELISIGGLFINHKIFEPYISTAIDNYF